MSEVKTSVKIYTETIPKVSVAIPVYNAGKLLKIMVDSVLAQTEQDFELILVDDGSTDNGETAKLVDEYAAKDKRVRAVHKANEGVLKTRVCGIELCRGEYVYVCDQDDYLHPQLLEFALWACRKYDLDYLKIKHEFGSVNATSRLKPLGEFAQEKVIVVDNKASSGEEIGEAIGKLHTDAWAQFGKRELLRQYPCSEYDVARVFYLVCAAKRWGLAETPLYYYHGDIASSMIHMGVSAQWIGYLHEGWKKAFDLFKARTTDEKGKTIFAYMCRKQIVNQIKVIFHMIKRLNKLNGRKERRAVWMAFGELADDFLFNRRIPRKHFGVKHYLEYLLFAICFKLNRWNTSNMR